MLLLLAASLFTACHNEKKQDFFKGTIIEITDDCYLVAPDDAEAIKEKGERILVPKEVIRKQEVDFAINERVQVVYRKIEDTVDGPRIDAVYAIYRESELP